MGNCPACNGTGFVFSELLDDYDEHQTCLSCGGDGMDGDPTHCQTCEDSQVVKVIGVDPFTGEETSEFVHCGCCCCPECEEERD